jgi:hypothetical protein
MLIAEEIDDTHFIFSETLRILHYIMDKVKYDENEGDIIVNETVRWKKVDWLTLLWSPSSCCSSPSPSPSLSSPCPSSCCSSSFSPSPSSTSG